MSAPSLVSVGNGIAGFQAVIAANYFPYVVETAGSEDDFQCASAAASMGSLRFSRTYVNRPFNGARLRTRRPRDINAFVVMLVEEGEVCFRGHRSAVARAGEMILMNADQPLETEQRVGGTSLAVSIPAPLLRLHYSTVDDWCLCPLSTEDGIPAVLKQCLTSCWEAQNEFHPVEMGDLTASVVHLIGAAFRERNDLPSFESNALHRHFLRIREIVAQNLTNENLGADFVVERLGISKSYLFMIMNAANTTLGRFVLDQRLEHSHDLLSDPATAERTITEIAFAAGFQDLSHFSRRFSERYGKSPRAHRGAALLARKQVL
jgi:AraC-like DNA-binding protein